MKKAFEHIALWKKVDIVFQCLVFVIMLWTICYTSLSIFGLYIMAIGQTIGCIIWTFVFSGDIPKMKSGNIIRILFIITVTVLGAILFLDENAFAIASIPMLIVGPILGASYFVISIKEYNFYSKARKPYYLL